MAPDAAGRTLATRVNASRFALQLSITDLATAVGMKPRTLSEKLKGRTEFTGSELIRLSIVLRATADQWAHGLFGVAA